MIFMDDRAVKCVAIFVLSFISFYCNGQRIISETPPAVNRYFLPYDLSYSIALKDKHFIQLREQKSNIMQLSRYNEKLNDVWQKDISFDMGESVPEIFLKGDTVVLYSHNTVKEKNKFIIAFRYFDLVSGEEIPGNVYPVTFSLRSGIWPSMSLSEDKSKMVIYNFLSDNHNENKACFQVYDIGDESMKFQYFLDKQTLHASKNSSIHLSNFGDIFYISSDAKESMIESYFWRAGKQEVHNLSTPFLFESQVDEIGEINISRQSVSSYFVSFTANYENSLVGFNITSYNVILKTVMFSHSQNLDEATIQSSLVNSYDFGSAEMSDLKTKNLQNYRLVKSIVNDEKDVILIFEDLTPIDNDWKVNNNMVWNPKIKKDKKYLAGGILMFCFSASGEQLWMNAVQKTQLSRASSLGHSFVERIDHEHLRLLMQESSNGSGIFMLEVNMWDGAISKVVDLLPGKNLNLSKKYSCWIDDKSLLICAVAPSNIHKKSFMLLELE